LADQGEQSSVIDKRNKPLRLWFAQHLQRLHTDKITSDQNWTLYGENAVQSFSDGDIMCDQRTYKINPSATNQGSQETTYVAFCAAACWLGRCGAGLHHGLVRSFPLTAGPFSVYALHLQSKVCHQLNTGDNTQSLERESCVSVA
jgi:hypothetical protein